MASRLLTLALFTLAALVQLAAGANSARGPDAVALASVQPLQGRARLRFDLLDVSESAALQVAAIEDSDENSASRYRADETRHSHDTQQSTSRSQRTGALQSVRRDALSGPSLVYRFCKLLI